MVFQRAHLSDFGAHYNPRRNTTGRPGLCAELWGDGDPGPIGLLIGDRPLGSSLQFSLVVEGFEIRDGSAGAPGPRLAAAQVAIIEKPLQGGELGAAIHAALAPRKTA